MSKVKSAIITAILVAAILVLGLFAVISCDVPGSNGVKKYNGFIGTISLGSEFTGEAYTMLYPEGVISAADYHLGENDKHDKEEDDYANKYEKHGGLYVEKDKIGKEFKDSVAKDAEILAKRFGAKGYSSYSVSVADDYAVKVTLPASFAYSAYKSFEDDYNSSLRSDKLTDLSHTVQYLIPDGILAIKDSADENGESILSFRETPNFYTYFKGASVYSMGGTNAVKIDLTRDGFTKLNTALLMGGSGSAYIFVGDECFQLTIEMGSALEDRSLMFQMSNNSKSYAEDFAIGLDSAIHNNIVTNSYNTDKAGSGTQIITQTSSFGKYAAIYLGVAILLVLCAAIVGNLVKYKKLGIVCGLMTLVYALIMVTALLVLEIELTMAGVFVLVLGLALLTFSNAVVFEAVRKETEAGRTIQAAVKVGYKKTLTTLLDMHIILWVVSAIIALVCVGELAACGLIFFVASLASYALYWFTRFMWYVLISPAKDKFAFCGFKREVYDDED